jgi:hypothetical protein
MNNEITGEHKGVIMRGLILLLGLCLTGCSVMQDAKTDFRKEMVGFKYNWDRFVLKKDVSYGYE